MTFWHADGVRLRNRCGYVVRTAQGGGIFVLKICLLNHDVFSYIPGGLPECPEPRRHRGAEVRSFIPDGKPCLLEIGSYHSDTKRAGLVAGL